MSMSLEGADRLQRKLDALPDNVNDEVYDEIRDFGDDVKDRSKERAPYRPGDSDHLRDHAYSHPSKTPNGAECEIGYDGPQDYLMVQHEGGWLDLVAWGVHYGPTRIENYTTPGTGPKFLEAPFAEMKPEGRARITGAAKRGLRDA